VVLLVAMVSAVPLKLRRLSSDSEVEAEAEAPNTAQGAWGVDISTQPAGPEYFKCLLKGAGYVPLKSPAKPVLNRVVEAGVSNSQGPAYTSAMISTLGKAAFTKLVVRLPLISGSFKQAFADAKTAGYQPKDLEAYFINFKASLGTKGAQAIVSQLQTYVSQIGVAINRVWLDVEKTPSGWTTTPATNCAYFKAVLAGLKALGTKFPSVGVYSSQNFWGQIMGATKCDIDYTHTPLWFAAYNSKFDQTPFTGIKQGTVVAWPATTPAVVQFHGTTTICGVSVDFNRYPVSYA